MSPSRLTLDDAGFPLLDGQPMPLAPKERGVLALLLRRQPAAVDKNDFAAAAWSGRPMSDESLARAVSGLRRAIAPLGLGIESVYGLGYRLAARPDAPAHARITPAAHASSATVDAYLHARQLVAQRTPTAVRRAIELLRELIAREPGYIAARVALVDALTAAVGWGQVATAGALDEGLAQLAHSRRLDPATPGLDSARGALLDVAWRFEEARGAHDAALARHAGDPDAHLALGRHFLYTGAADLAVDCIREAMRLSPHAPLVKMTLSRALVQAGRGAEGLAVAEAAAAEHPGQLLLFAFALAMRAMVDPTPEIEAPARRLAEGAETPPFVWTVLSFVLARLGRREDALDIIEAVLICSQTTAGEATLYAAPLAALGEFDRAAALLQRACDERCGMLAMVLRDPAHAGWLGAHPIGRELMRDVFGVRRELQARGTVPEA
jgi:DNA-binding winged helix-turn-helix (wHTH) protein/Flp pilus assembly protein TadD